MADIIRLTAEQVTNAANHFAEAAESFTDLQNKLYNVVTDLSSGWEGDAHNAFVSNYEEIRTSLNSVVELYQGLDAKLKAVVQTMQEVDSALAGSM